MDSKKLNNYLTYNSILSWVSLFCFIIAIFGFGYLFVEIKGVHSSKKKDASISCQLANGNAPGIISFLVTGGFLLALLIVKNEGGLKKLIHSTNETKIPYEKIIVLIRLLCILILVCLVITIIWISPYKYQKTDKEKEEKISLSSIAAFKDIQKKHNSIAAVAFTATLVYICLTYYTLTFYQKSLNDKQLEYILIGAWGISIIAYLILIGIGIASASGNAKSYDLALFPIGEILFFLSFLASIIIYGIYWRKIIENDIIISKKIQESFINNAFVPIKKKVLVK